MSGLTWQNFCCFHSHKFLHELAGTFCSQVTQGSNLVVLHLDTGSLCLLVLNERSMEMAYWLLPTSGPPKRERERDKVWMSTCSLSQKLSSSRCLRKRNYNLWWQQPSSFLEEFPKTPNLPWNSSAFSRAYYATGALKYRIPSSCQGMLWILAGRTHLSSLISTFPHCLLQ